MTILNDVLEYGKSLPGFLKRRQFPVETDSLQFSDSRLLDEELFEMHFQQECKRSERTRIPFLFMLIDVASIAGIGLSRILQPIENELYDITRAHDYKGWYRNGTVIGIIFTDVPVNNNPDIWSRIEIRLRTALGNALTGMSSISLYRISGTKIELLQGGGQGEICAGPQVTFHQEVLRRGVDILGSLAGIILFAPLLVMVALFVKSTSKGPVLFKQERVGRNGKPFYMLKFRSMYTDNDDSIHREFVARHIRGEIAQENTSRSETVFKIQKDPRVTPVGRIIRKTSLDELPQFFNVLRGEMSIVGPRPALQYEVDDYEIWHCRRVIAKPGITGFWQVEGRSSTTFDTMVRMDIRYIERRSLLQDLRLIVKTPFSMFSAKGAC